MKAGLLVGIMMVLFGLGALVYQGVSYKSEEKILGIGPIQATTEKTKTIPISPIVGGLAVIGGIAIVIATTRRGAMTA